MPRPKKCRRVCGLPSCSEFGPAVCERSEALPVLMSVEEYEAIRLIDYQGCTQEECSVYMCVARTTAQQIYNSARAKLAAALVESRPLRIEGGSYRLCEAGREAGAVESGESDGVRVVTGELKLGEATGVPVISAALEAAGDDGLTVIDCPPGSSCAVMESARGADYCVLVTEPTAFGLHDLRLVAELMRVLKKPCGVVVNKADADYPELERWLEAEGLPVLARISYSERLAELGARGALACREDEGARSLFSGLLTRIRGEAAE